MNRDKQQPQDKDSPRTPLDELARKMLSMPPQPKKKAAKPAKPKTSGVS